MTRAGKTAGPHRLEGAQKVWIERGRTRLTLCAVVFAAAFFGIGLRLVELTVMGGEGEPTMASSHEELRLQIGRADIVDRNGALLATSLPTASLYADPKLVRNPKEAARRLAATLPGLDEKTVLARLTEDRRFVWLKRHLTPDEQYAANRLGIPGLEFRREELRAYPMGRLAAHAVGYSDIDGHGLAGAERAFDSRLRTDRSALTLSLDARVQQAMRSALGHAMTQYSAIGACGMVLDVRTGEILAMVSLPDFDPNHADDATADQRFNRATLGAYEMGSTFKIFTVAMALETGAATLADRYDARKPLHIDRFVIRDYHAKKRMLSVPEIFIYSSNIGSALMARDVGIDRQQDYLRRFGLLDPAQTELREIATPLLPDRWREVNALTIAFGHGLSVSPLQLVAGVASTVNGGIYRAPTILRSKVASNGRRVISPGTSAKVRELMRLAVLDGTGKKADAEGYLVGGKTGSSEKVVAGRYSRKSLVSSFVGAFPIDAPRFVVFAMLDEPKGTKETFGYATGGWVAAPVVREVVERIAPLYDIGPVPEDTAPDPRLRVEISADGARRADLASN